MDTTISKIQERLFLLQDLKHQQFVQKLIPTIPPETIIGLRTPQFRAYAKELAKQPEAAVFLRTLPHVYFEENNLHGCLIENIRNFDEAMAQTETFLPYINNWATCDTFSPKIFKKHPAEVYERIRTWLKSDHVYTVRYGIGLLLGNYLDQEFQPEMIDLVAGVSTEEYYVKMMIAWYFASALVKQYAYALPVLHDKQLEKWTHNKTIQKAIESYRISDEIKVYLRTLKIK